MRRPAKRVDPGCEAQGCSARDPEATRGWPSRVRIQSHRVQQVVGDVVGVHGPALRLVRELAAPVAGEDEDGRGAHGAPGLQVLDGVADHVGGGQVDPHLLARARSSIPGLRLAAVAFPPVGGLSDLGVVRAVVDPVQARPCLGQHRAHTVVHLVHQLLAEVAAGHPGLVGDDHGLEAGLVGAAGWPRRCAEGGACGRRG